MKNIVFRLLTVGIILLNSSLAIAQDFGGKNGGDSLEIVLSEINSAIVSWINNGGARLLTFPPNLNQSEYESRMIEILTDRAVKFSFTSDDILVNGVEKDCENIPLLKEVRCNIERFRLSSAFEQFLLVHHEYAGLVGIESNLGSPASNYYISKQLSSFLENSSSVSLSMNKDSEKLCKVYSESQLPYVMVRILKRKGYQVFTDVSSNLVRLNAESNFNKTALNKSKSEIDISEGIDKAENAFSKDENSESSSHSRFLISFIPKVNAIGFSSIRIELKDQFIYNDVIKISKTLKLFGKREINQKSLGKVFREFDSKLPYCNSI